METRDLETNAAKKLAAKHCDMLVANNLRTPGAGFAADTNVVTVLTPGETADRPSIERWSKMGKETGETYSCQARSHACGRRTALTAAFSNRNNRIDRNNRNISTELPQNAKENATCF